MKFVLVNDRTSMTAGRTVRLEFCRRDDTIVHR
jgi:hypothetical protein